MASRGEMKMHMRTRHTRCAPELANMGPANKARLPDTHAILGQQLHFCPMKGNWLNPSLKIDQEGEVARKCVKHKACSRRTTRLGNGDSGCVVSCCAWVVRRWPACLWLGAAGLASCWVPVLLPGGFWWCWLAGCCAVKLHHARPRQRGVGGGLARPSHMALTPPSHPRPTRSFPTVR